MLSAQHHRAAVDTLRALTARHPFDAAAWYQLGAAYFHVGRRVLITPDDYRRALSRAVELDPAQVLPYLHLIEDAFAREDEGKDYDAMLALWAADASATAFGNTYEGPVAIADFFETSGPFVNGWAALVPSYRTQIQVQGNRATFAFECVYVPDTGNLAGQTVVAHLNASGTAVKVGNRWLFEEFVGGIASVAHARRDRRRRAGGPSGHCRDHDLILVIELRAMSRRDRSTTEIRLETRQLAVELLDLRARDPDTEAEPLQLRARTRCSQ